MLKFRACAADQLHHAALVVHPTLNLRELRWVTGLSKIDLHLQQPCSLWNTRLLQHNKRKNALCRMGRLTVQKVRDQLRTTLQRLAEKSFSSRISLHRRNTNSFMSHWCPEEAWRRTCHAGRGLMPSSH